MNYKLANPAIFRTIQGEGILSGVPMVFIRLANCSIACKGCDTNYAPSITMNELDISKEASRLMVSGRWVWLTGGEPFDYDLEPLLSNLKLIGKVAVITSGQIANRFSSHLIDSLFVSPHGKPDKLKLVRGLQVNLVPSLGGTNLEDWVGYDFSGFQYKYVTPFDKDKLSIKQCIEWVNRYPDWRLGIQAHKVWNID